jgi:benzoyl-CoA reductase/2-hydroxyglutaryl-CoA dehydratase subunit BcrC/BadD/HgdB
MTDRRIGITSTVPVEILLAAGHVPVDLNNVLIESASPLEWVRAAEDVGFPRNCCSWIKGIYSAVRAEGIRTVIAVTEGDCAHTHALMEVLADDGVETIPFAYPTDRSYMALSASMGGLAERLAITLDAAQETKGYLDGIRAFAHEVDRLTWETDQATGSENHLALVNCSDFARVPEAYGSHLREVIVAASSREARPPEVRLGLLGVPPICTGLHAGIEELGARVVFCEIPRQFSMPYGTDDLVDQYRLYTYPYGAMPRIDDIRQQAALRRLDGLIHYVQSFCFRQIGDILLRRYIGLPMLTIEGDHPGPVDAATRLRIETFAEMLRRPGE